MSNTDSKRIELIRRVPLFSDVEDSALEKLGQLMTIKNYPKDSLVFGYNEPGDAMYVIASGRVKVVLYGESGREITLTFFKRADFFGEMALLDDMPRSANVVTTEKSSLLVLKRDAFKKHLVENPQTAINILAEISRRLRSADEIISNLALLDVYGRVARVLIDLAAKDGRQVEEGIQIDKRPTQQDIASVACSSRETVSRVLNDLKKRGLLIMDGKKTILRSGFSMELIDK
jgi:CRP-like cAMP-binding protein